MQNKPSIFSVLVLVFTLILCGCNRKTSDLEPGKLTLFTPQTQMAQPGSVITNAVRIELMSRADRGVFGGTGTSYPIAGARLRVEPVNPQSGIKALTPVATTDAGGVCVFDVITGNNFGDQLLDIICLDKPDVRQRVRFVAGVAIENSRQEITSGQMLPKPLRIRLTSPAGAPLINTPLYFSLSRQPGKNGKLSHQSQYTDTNGVVEINLQSDRNATGHYEIQAEVADYTNGYYTRPFAMEAMAMSVSNTAIGVLGGLALFIFGMTLMSDGLNQAAGKRMKAALAYVTRNRVAAIFAGTIITAIIQSSSATTVMTVGFVNAGMLSLQQAIGVIFGANIGTTVTGQLVSFKLEGLAMPAIIFGTISLLLVRRDIWQGCARSVLGFGILFFGMTLMTAELGHISSFPSFVRFFQYFDCTPQPGQSMPLGAVLGAIGIGTATTMLVQSSSATIGLAIALANSGLLNIWTAVPIVLGDNIGTTITAILASLTTNRTARQAAVAHSLFNIIGTCAIVILFYVPYRGMPCFLQLINAVTQGNVFAGENVGRHVAMAHTFFNLLNVLLMTPFIGYLSWLCEHIIPARKAPTSTVLLEKHLLSTPPLALFCAMRALATMTDIAWGAASAALRGHHLGRPVKIADIEKIEDEVDRYQVEIMAYLVQLTRHNLTLKQAEAIPVLMHCVNDAERISDLALIIARRSATQAEQCVNFSDDAQQELENLIDKAFAVANLTHESLQDGRFLAKTVEAIALDLKKMAADATQMHVNRLQKGLCTPERGLIYVEVISALMHIVRHLENIAQRSDQLTEAAT